MVKQKSGRGGGFGGGSHRKGAPIKKGFGGSSGGGSKQQRGGGFGSGGDAKGNPFDELNNARALHQVINRRGKGAVRNVAKARSAAFERRTKTLLVEHKNRRSANSFVDKRFGEGAQSMTVEERMYARFKRARQKRARGSGRPETG